MPYCCKMIRRYRKQCRTAAKEILVQQCPLTKFPTIQYHTIRHFALPLAFSISATVVLQLTPSPFNHAAHRVSNEKDGWRSCNWEFAGRDCWIVCRQAYIPDRIFLSQTKHSVTRNIYTHIQDQYNSLFELCPSLASHRLWPLVPYTYNDTMM